MIVLQTNFIPTKKTPEAFYRIKYQSFSASSYLPVSSSRMASSSSASTGFWWNSFALETLKYLNYCSRFQFLYLSRPQPHPAWYCGFRLSKILASFFHFYSKICVRVSHVYLFLFVTAHKTPTTPVSQICLFKWSFGEKRYLAPNLCLYLRSYWCPCFSIYESSIVLG